MFSVKKSETKIENKICPPPPVTPLITAMLLRIGTEDKPPAKHGKKGEIKIAAADGVCVLRYSFRISFTGRNRSAKLRKNSAGYSPEGKLP